ncbi:GIY-YIG nuclease family protein [Curtobacterium sp. Csp2]|uniref:GIY-YIG nuclease family protein n=1 Tax=Curtobacterium sp. Csp2 TaxID=2495430 RepID=UPI001581308E|nr:GIY-YIG nuclease family protein [Curtobacterium sp. Csp2]QKS15727.1 GIY-YIG nuclease family protein [Curtobacterium sp. Csp2]
MSLPAGGGFRFDSGCGHVNMSAEELGRGFDSMARTAIEASVGPGYYEFRQTAYAHPEFVRALFDELQLELKLHARRMRTEMPVQVYFLQEQQNGYIKIGATRNFDKRLKTLQTGSAKPLVILGVVDGSFALEADIHRELMDHQLEGEWFEPNRDVLSVIARHMHRAA